MRQQTTANFTHTLINKLSAIVGQCQLLREEMPEEAKYIERVRVIETVANSMSDEIKAQQRGRNSMKRAG